ncbi:hypothetical protein CCR95_06770 [Thiocystis minor]|uniref:chemotaxis protein CheW n=1 Tax=Thiocystis minor TaxID=61597 RepID=UPI00191263CE|nr:chemotaxis protein CheW [Thiocystis minor]MBK5963793.1 hypothetical protein [Thiocystis minor]
MSLFGAIAALLGGSQRAPASPSDTHRAETRQQASEPDGGAVGHAFRVGARWFLLPVALPAEVTPALPCVRLPFTPPWFLGLANFRGEPVPVYDLGALLQAPGATPDIGRYNLILGTRDRRGAFLIEEIRLLTLPTGTDFDLAPALPTISAMIPDGLPCHGAVIEGTTYTRLDFSALLGILADRASLLGEETHSSKDQP